MTKDKETPETVSEEALENAQGGASGVPGMSFNSRMFNPQPEPPASPLQQNGFDPTGEVSARGFNPQPEPPPIDPLTGKVQKL